VAYKAYKTLRRDTLLGVNGSVPALVALLKSGAPEVVLPAIKLILTFVQVQQQQQQPQCPALLNQT